jgi:hypothetical protein
MRLVVSNSTPLPGNKGSSKSNKTSSSSPSLTSSRSSPPSKTSPDVKRIVQQIAAQLLAIGQVRPNIVILEAQAVANVFAMILPRQPLAMRLPLDDAAARRRRIACAPMLLALTQLGAMALFG